MKKILTIISLIVLIPTLFAQKEKKDGNSDIPLAVVAARQHDMPQTVNTSLENKLHQIILQNGLGSADYHGRFVITASMVSTTKDILAGPPKQFVENMDITLYIVDMMDYTIFSSVTFPVKVVESSEEKACLSAIRSINVKSPQIISFINEGRDKIITYYTKHADQIIYTAKNMAKQRNYEAALYELCAIPAACGEAYIKAASVAGDIYQEYVDYLCVKNLAKAKSEWMSKQNAEGAYTAGEFLSQIYPDAKCYNEANLLYKEIKSKLLDDWKFEMRKYQDGISIEEQRIQAWKSIGTAYGNHQQPVNYSTNWIVR